MTTPSGGTRARTVVAVIVAGLLLAALLNADDLDRRARAERYGWQRSAATAVTGALHTLSHALGLDRPREALDRALGHDGGSAGPAPVPTPSGGRALTRRPTAGDPLRVYVGGDSVSQVFGQSLARAGERTGVVTTTVEYRFSTGLTRPDYFDWPGRLRTVLARSPRPEVVVVMLGANDVQRILADGRPVAVGTAAWAAEYRRRVAATMDLLAASGVDTYWVGQPLMRSATLSERVGELDDIYAEEAARHPGVTFLDTRPLLADASGGYTAYLPGGDGRPVRVRAADGVHLTPAGGDRVAHALLDLVAQRWGPLGPG